MEMLSLESFVLRESDSPRTAVKNVSLEESENYLAQGWKIAYAVYRGVVDGVHKALVLDKKNYDLQRRPLQVEDIS